MKIDIKELGVNVSPIIYFNVSLYEDYRVGKYDHDGREFIGGNLNSLFYELGINDECKNEIENFLKNVKEKGESRIITFIMNRNELPHLVDITGRYLQDEELCYAISIWDIANLETHCMEYQTNMLKYKGMLGMSGQIYFDYFLDSNQIVAYRYVGRKSIRLFYDTFDVFMEKIMENAELNDRNVVAIENLKEQLREGKSNVDITIKSGMLHMDGKIQKLLFKARYDSLGGKRMMYGIITNLSGDENDLPYYMTNAGLDSATGVLSKRSIIEYSDYVFNSEATKHRKHYMALIDIDDFKRINDNFGHQVGDQAISILANVLSDMVRDNGMVGRYGGDEFFILTDKIEDEEVLRSLLRRIRSNVQTLAAETLSIEKFTLSIGISTYPDDGDNYKDLLAIADKCLYIAKEKGKDRYIIYRPEMHSGIETGSVKKSISSYDEQSKAINRVVVSLFKEGEKAVAESMSDIVKSFDLDSIDIFYKDMASAAYSCGKYPSGLVAEDFFRDESYGEMFDLNGVHVLNNLPTLRHTHEAIYDMLSEKKCMSAIQIAQPSFENPEYFFTCNMLNRNHKWSDAEVSNLCLFGTLIYEILLKS
ncbi:MAG: GGDEF domain-containing protein [Lachnospiraceae bacterium]|nr:GGDEF domain-containing protein [Lachnospiraceae bacterium]